MGCGGFHVQNPDFLFIFSLKDFVSIVTVERLILEKWRSYTKTDGLDFFDIHSNGSIKEEYVIS
jgi:hypothetical protein